MSGVQSGLEVSQNCQVQSNPGGRMECTLTKSVDNTKHGEIINMMEYKATACRNLSKLNSAPAVTS